MLNEQNLRLIDEAVKEWKGLNKGREWKSWMKIAVALYLGSREVMHDVGTNNARAAPITAPSRPGAATRVFAIPRSSRRPARTCCF